MTTGALDHAGSQHVLIDDQRFLAVGTFCLKKVVLVLIAAAALVILVLVIPVEELLHVGQIVGHGVQLFTQSGSVFFQVLNGHPHLFQDIDDDRDELALFGLFGIDPQPVGQPLQIGDLLSNRHSKNLL